MARRESITFTSQSLYDLVWSKPMTEIAVDFGMSSVAFAKHCKHANVPIPGRGYWQRIEHGHREKQTPLPKANAPEKIVIDKYEERAASPRRPPGEISRVEIAERIARYHPVAKELDESLKVDAVHQSMLAVRGHRLVTLKVGEVTRKRALRVLHTLFSAVEEHGHQVRLSKPPEKSEWTRAPRTLEFVVGDAAIEVSIREHLNQRPHEKADSEKKWAFMARKYDLEPSGDLVFEITVPWGTDTRTRWRENEKQRFEDLLGEIVWAVDRAAETFVAHRAKVADDAKQAEIVRKIAEDVASERKRKAEEERQRREREERRAAYQKALHDDLVGMAADWREADAVRAFLSAVDATVPDAVRTEKFNAWFTWASEHALRMDPLRSPDGSQKNLSPLSRCTRTSIRSPRLRRVACAADVTHKLHMAKTGFDKYVAEQMRKPTFAKKYAGARAEIDAIDRIVRALDDARIDLGLTKAELARRIAAKPEIVRRLFTSKAPNPTLSTILRVATALGYNVQLVPAKRTRKRAT